MVTQIGNGSHGYTAKCRRCPVRLEVRADEQKGPSGIGAMLRDAGWTAIPSGVTHSKLGELVDFICPDCTNKPTDYIDIRDNVYWSAKRAVDKLNDERFTVGRLGDMDVIVEFSGSADPNDNAIRFHFYGGEERVHVYPCANFAPSRPELDTHATIEEDGTFVVGDGRMDVHRFAEQTVRAFARRMLSLR